MGHFFTESNLAALREIAMRHAAHEVEERPPATAAVAERILICVTGNPASAGLIRRGKRVADYLRGECIAVHVLPEGGWAETATGHRESVERHLQFARSLRVDAHVIAGRGVAKTVADFARSRGVTQIFVGRSAKRGWLGETVVMELARLASETQVTIVSQRRRGS